VTQNIKKPRHLTSVKWSKRLTSPCCGNNLLQRNTDVKCGNLKKKVTPMSYAQTVFWRVKFHTRQWTGIFWVCDGRLQN